MTDTINSNTQVFFYSNTAFIPWACKSRFTTLW